MHSAVCWRQTYIEPVKPPRRLSIPGCIGCGAMRQYESCEGACRERRLKLVRGDYDKLTADVANERAIRQAQADG